jgi:hypothetical protein
VTGARIQLLLDGIHSGEVVMVIDRRQFLSTSASVSAGLVLRSTEATASDDLGPDASWEQVRELFELRRDRIHMSGLLFASHPKPRFGADRDWADC